MNRTARLSFTLVALGTALLISACEKRSLVMVYDGKWDRLVPVLETGSEITWRGIKVADVRWGGGDSPCDPGTTDRCVIKEGLHGKRFGYKCVGDTPCDPEIMVDDGGLIVRDAVADARPAGMIPIDVYCPGGALTIEAPPSRLRPGDSVGWRPMGIREAEPWVVTFRDQAAACRNGGPIKSEDGYCTLAAVGSYVYTFTSTASGCSASVDATLVVEAP